MTLKRTVIFSIFWALSVALCSVAAEPAAKTPDREQMRERLEQRIHTFISMRMADELKLDEKKEEVFLNLIRKHFKEKKDLAREQFQILGEIRGDLKKTSGNDDRFRALLDKLEKNRAQQSEQESKFFQIIRKELSTRQQAQLVVLWPVLQDEVRKMIAEKKQGKRGIRGMREKPSSGQSSTPEQ